MSFLRWGQGFCGDAIIRHQKPGRILPDEIERGLFGGLEAIGDSRGELADPVRHAFAFGHPGFCETDLGGCVGHWGDRQNIDDHFGILAIELGWIVGVAFRPEAHKPLAGIAFGPGVGAQDAGLIVVLVIGFAVVRPASARSRLR